MQLTYFKLYTGEEIVAPSTKTERGWHITNPAVLLHMPDYKIALANWLPYTKVESGALLPYSAVMLMLDVADDMTEYYTKWMNPEQNDMIKVDQNGEVLTDK